MKKQIYKFFTESCCQCKAISPNLHKVLESYPSIELVEIDAEENDDLVDKYNLRSLPTLIFLVDGEEKGRMVGMQTEQQLKEKIDNTLIS